MRDEHPIKVTFFILPTFFNFIKITLKIFNLQKDY